MSSTVNSFPREKLHDPQRIGCRVRHNASVDTRGRSPWTVLTASLRRPGEPLRHSYGGDERAVLAHSLVAASVSTHPRPDAPANESPVFQCGHPPIRGMVRSTLDRRYCSIFDQRLHSRTGTTLVACEKRARHTRPPLSFAGGRSTLGPGRTEPVRKC
jgi:hypothetical protein